MGTAIALLTRHYRVVSMQEQAQVIANRRIPVLDPERQFAEKATTL